MNWVPTFSWADFSGHISYVLIALSYYMSNIFRLRVIACVGLIFEIVYFALSGGNLAVGIVWDVIFVAINAWQLWRLTRDRFGLVLDIGDAEALAPLTLGLDRAQVGRILKAGRFLAFGAGEHIARQGHPISALSFVLNGRARVVVDGRLIAQINPGSTIGEISFARGGPATADVIAEIPTRVLSIEHEAVRKLCRNDNQISTTLHRLLSADLTGKLASATALASRGD